jgi:hypothetical protein
LDPYPSPGPIFIHEHRCKPFAGDGFPDELRSLPLVLEAFGDERAVLAQERVRDGAVEAAIDRLLAFESVRYVHVRNLEAGCFIAQVERVG